MDADYINTKLIKFAELLYGKDSGCYSKSKDDSFVFGSKKTNMKNTVTKQVAMYIVTNQML